MSRIWRNETAMDRIAILRTSNASIEPLMKTVIKNVTSWAYEIVEGLGRCWFLLLATLVVAFLLALVPQGREALWAASASGHSWHVRAFFATSLAGAVLMTLFASEILDSSRLPASSPSYVQLYVKYAVPGLVGLLAAFLVPLLIQRQFGENAWLLPQRRVELRELGTLFQRLAVPVVVLARCPAVLTSLFRFRKSDRAQRHGAVGLILFGFAGFGLTMLPFVTGTCVLFAGLLVLDLFWWRTGLQPSMRRWRRTAGIVMAFGWIAAGVWLSASPTTRATAIGPATIVLFAEYFWVAIAFVLYLFFGRWLTQGVSIVAMICAVVAFMTGPFNMRSVRTIEAAAIQPGSDPISLSKHIDAWLEARRSRIESSPGPWPVFVASAEGGGIRAACWTAGVLSAVQDAEPQFADHLLGISGVSGGSLGAATFVALVDAQRTGQIQRTDMHDGIGPMQALADEILGQDFLSPVMATMLIPDVAACLLHADSAADRASVLEQAFEIAWRDAIGTETFAKPFDAIWSGSSGHWIPSLFLNSTETDTGRRIVNSHVSFGSGSSTALALPDLLPSRSIRLSTAVLLSARFPVISPVASVQPKAAGDPLHIVDGGYADNSGTLTADEVVRVLFESAERLGLRNRIRIAAIVITDNPIMIGSGPSDADRQHRERIASTAAGALLSPFETLDSVRQSLSKKHRDSFENLVTASGGEVLDGFALSADRIEFPLGWMLSQATREALTRQIRSLKAEPDGDFQRIRELLGSERSSAK
jgi:hypothetical protein